MTDTIKIHWIRDNEDYLTVVEPILKAIFKYLDELSKKSTEPNKIYFSGEFDSNQTDFEEQSNQLKVGVITNNETTGLVLLRLLRIIIDKNPNLFWYDLENLITDDTSDFEVSVADIIHAFAKGEELYMTSFELNGKLITRACDDNKIIIERRLDEVDIWTLKRVSEHEFDF